MKVFYIGMAMLIAAVFLIAYSLATDRKEAYREADKVWQKSGLPGEHSLVRIESVGATAGKISGSFFLGTGSVNGTGAEEKMRFYWSPKRGEMVATTLAYSKFRFIIDEAKSVPTVEFVFNGNCQIDESDPNLNECVMSDSYLKLAKVKISSATLEKEVYLLKIR
jgi:hypothetical protein